MLYLFKCICSSRFCWFILLLSGIAFEVCGWYFQYHLHLNPCVNCVYERAYILGFVLVGFIGAVAANFLIVRLLCSLGLIATSLGGFMVALEHVVAYNNISFGTIGFNATCKLSPEFPPFLPLDELVPFLFKASGMCNEKLPWEFLGLDMPSWVLIIFTCSLLAGIMLLLGNFSRKAAPNVAKFYR